MIKKADPEAAAFGSAFSVVFKNEKIDYNI